MKKKLLITTFGNAKSSISRFLPPEAYSVEEIRLGEIAAIDCEVPRCDWIVITSKNAIAALEKTRHIRPRIAAVGEETANAIKAHGFDVAFTSAGGNAESLANGLKGFLKPSDLVVRLIAKGIDDKCKVLAGLCNYRVIEAYENKEVKLSMKIDLSRYDILVVTASSAVARLFSSVIDLPCRIIAIGPSVAGELRKRGIVCEMAPKPSLKAVAEMIATVR